MAQAEITVRVRPRSRYAAQGQASTPVTSRMITSRSTQITEADQTPMATDNRSELTRNTLAILCILGLIGLSFWVLRPFLAATVWATMIVVATWPVY